MRSIFCIVDELITSRILGFQSIFEGDIYLNQTVFLSVVLNALAEFQNK